MRTLTFVLLALIMSSCATIFTGMRQNVNIESNPPGARIYIDGRDMGTTPATVKVHKDFDVLSDGGKDIKLLMEGYEDDYFLDATLNPVAILNVTNLLAWAIDCATGAVMRFDKHQSIDLTLPPDPNGPSNPARMVNPVSKSSEDDRYDRLRKLKGLYDDGVINQEEYEREKSKILAE